MKKETFTLIKDVATIKEAFIIDELQSYMDLSDPSNPFWVTPVRVRLQEKKDWEMKVKNAIEKVRQSLDFKHDPHNSAESDYTLRDLEKELGI